MTVAVAVAVTGFESVTGFEFVFEGGLRGVQTGYIGNKTVRVHG